MQCQEVNPAISITLLHLEKYAGHPRREAEEGSCLDRSLSNFDTFQHIAVLLNTGYHSTLRQHDLGRYRQTGSSEAP